MTPSDRAALREAAEACPERRWRGGVDGDRPCIRTWDSEALVVLIPGMSAKAIDYIALAPPAAVLSLLDAADERDRLLELLASVLSSLEIHLPYAPWHGGNAVDESGSLIVHPDSLIARARASLEATP